MLTQARFPSVTHHSLAALPSDHELRKLYPIDIYPNPRSVKLPLGETTYWLVGPEDGPKVALIPGISHPSLAFRHIAPTLVERGFRLLIYDLYGRGYSEAPADPAVEYDANMYITQLALLFQHVGFEKAYIVGYSMGGAIAVAFATIFPNLVNGKIVLIASSGVMDPVPAGRIKFPSPDSFEGGKVPITALPPSFNVPFTRLQLENLPGFYRAVTSSIILGPLRGLKYAFEAVAAQVSVKVLLIHGNEDTVVPFACSQRIKDIITSAELVVVDGAGHDMVLDPANVGYNVFEESLVKFLSS